MKNKSILYTLIACLSFSHINGFASTIDCNSNDTECMNRLFAEANNSQNNAILVVLGLVVVVGYLALKKNSDKPTIEEATFRAKEIANGYGIRLNSIHSPIRVSLFPSRQDRFMNHMQSNYNLNESNSNYLSVGLNF